MKVGGKEDAAPALRGVKASPLKIEKNGDSLEILRVFEIFSGVLGVCPPETRF